MSSEPAAKFFVNEGVVSTREDMLNILRPLVRQTISYRYFRDRNLISHGTGWVERIVTEQPDVSTFFTPIAVTLNIDSFERLEFTTGVDQLLMYTLVQGDERVVMEFAPIGDGSGRPAFEPQQLAFDTSGFVQMELLGLEAAEE